jgi:diguanylate cyclase (GGDEF)-like protein
VDSEGEVSSRMKWHTNVRTGEIEETSPAGRSLWTVVLLLTLLLLPFVPHALPPLATVALLALLGVAILRLQKLVREQNQSRQTLKRYIRVLQSVFDNMGEGVLVADSEGRLLGYNTAAEQVLRFALPDAFTPEWSKCYGVYLSDKTTPLPMDELPLLRAAQGETIDDAELYICHGLAPQGIWLSCSARPLREENGEQWGGLMVIQDVTERKRAEHLLREKMRQVSEYSALLLEANARLEELATTDELTSLKNRRAFCKSLDQEMQRASRYSTPLSLLILDVDKFKAYNDSFGHLEGDDVLRQVARILEETARKTDVAARYGGEEFALILPNTDRQGAVALAERIRESVAQVAWTLRQVTISIGVATLDPEETVEEGEDFVVAADLALYAAKGNGRNRVVHAEELARTAGHAIVRQKEKRLVA